MRWLVYSKTVPSLSTTVSGNTNVPFESAVPTRLKKPQLYSSMGPPVKRTVVPSFVVVQRRTSSARSSRKPSGTVIATSTIDVSSAATPTFTVALLPGLIETGKAQKCAAAGSAGRTNAAVIATVERMPTRLRRTLVTIATALLALFAAADPAAARSVSGVGASNFQTRLHSVTPDVPGIRVRVVEVGSRIELTNDTGKTVIVIGYQDEPYLRVGPNGVYENRRSPAVYINRKRQGTTFIPGNANPEAEPEWRRISTGNVARWHDHRIHWMGFEDPPAVQRDPDRTHVVIPKWTITMRMGAQTIRARGDLRWVPGPTPLPWLGIAVVVGAGVVALAALTSNVDRNLAIVLAVLLFLDVLHAIGIGWSKAGGTSAKLTEAGSAAVPSVIGWALGVVALVLLGRSQRAGFYVAACAGLLIAIFGGVADYTGLTRSQIPFGWSGWIARLLVALTLGLGIGLIAASIIGIRRTAPPRRRGTRQRAVAAST
jgi:hypothetical protein